MMEHELQDSFNDEELTQMAHEIAKELLPQVPYLFAVEDDNDALLTIETIHSHKSLCIVDRTPLEPNDSLNCHFPAIPEKTKSMPSIPTVPKHRKNMIERLEIYKHDAAQTMYLPLPYYGGISTDVLRERRRKKRNNVSSIPDFTQKSGNHRHKYTKHKNTKKRANTVSSPTSSDAHRQTHKKRSNTITLQKKRKGKKRPIPRIISPIMIDCDHHFSTKHNQQPTRDTLQVVSPARSKRSQSHPVEIKSPLSPSGMTISLQRDDEYLVECNDGFMFVSARQRAKDHNE